MNTARTSRSQGRLVRLVRRFFSNFNPSFQGSPPRNQRPQHNLPSTAQVDQHLAATAWCMAHLRQPPTVIISPSPRSIFSVSQRKVKIEA